LNLSRLGSISIIFLAIALFSSACVKRVTVPEVLGVNPPIPTEELINRINSFAAVKTFSAQAGVQVINYFTEKNAKADIFPEANGAIRFQRPENIRMRVTAPVINSQVADMVSDGQQFRLAIHYPTDKKQFLFGSNLQQLEHMAADEIRKSNDPRVSEAGGLLNMRPQHVTDAFLIKTPSITERSEVFREEVRMEEPDTRRGKKGRMVARSYYVLYVIEHNEGGQAVLRRKFWFDRNESGTPLVRQQTFENGNGRLGSDIRYMDWFPVPGGGWQWPRRVMIDRRNDGYGLNLTLEKDSVEINADLPETTFVLENTDNYKEVNLDTPRKASTDQAGKPKTATPRH
jgi:hypothetical protein